MKQSSRKSQESVSNFIEKTYNILESEENSEIVGWTPKGNSFVIKDMRRFEEFILPTYFKHSNFSSFVRQLNMYSFHKVRGDRLDCEFEHEKFKKGQRELLSKIKRKQSESFIMSQNLLDEGTVGQSLLDSSETIKRQSNNLFNNQSNVKQIAPPQSPQKHDITIEEVAALRKQNRALKVVRESALLKQKSLSSASNQVVGEKFYKLVACLLAEKIKKELNIEENLKEEEQKLLGNLNFDQVIEHVLSSSQSPLEFARYSSTAKLINNQQSDFSFMMSRPGPSEAPAKATTLQ